MTRWKKPVEFKLRLYPGRDDDLIRWLDGLENRHYGARSQAVRDALRQGIGIAGPPQPAAPTTDLAAIRQVVEAAVATGLAHFEGRIAGAVAAPTPDDETEALLASLGAALELGEGS